MNTDDTLYKQKQELTRITGDYYSDERIQRIFMAMFDKNSSSVLLKIPFLLLDSKNKQSVRLSCSGIDGWSVSISQDKDNNLNLHATEHLSGADRAPVIESFLELETLLNHLMMITIGAYSPVGDPKFSADVFSKLSISFKLQLAKQKNIITPSTFKVMNRLADYRNKVVHLLSVSSLRYVEDKESNEDYFKDCGLVKDTLSESYKSKQDQVIEYLLRLITAE